LLHELGDQFVPVFWTQENEEDLNVLFSCLGTLISSLTLSFRIFLIGVVVFLKVTFMLGNSAPAPFRGLKSDPFLYWSEYSLE
jgi:hypothetical protein